MTLSGRPAAVVRAVQAAVPMWSARLAAGRQVDSAFSGLHATRRKGPGESWAEARVYEPGDDVRRIDWSATARTGSVQVRDTLADRALRVTLVVDCSGSMAFGTDTVAKADVALAVCTAVALVGARQGDSTAALLATPAAAAWIPPGSGVDHVNVMLRRFAASFGTEGTVDFAAAVRRAGALARAAGVVVVVSDFHDPAAAEELRRLAVDHRTIAVVVDDLREREMVPVGNVGFVDPESGDVFEFETDSAVFRRRFTEIADRRRVERFDALARSGAEIFVAATGPGWLADVARIAGRLS
jgi:uncharacterized protein (DUF58 family)